MTNVTTKPDSSQPLSETAVHLFDNWFDPIEAGLRGRVREFINAMIEDSSILRYHGRATLAARSGLARKPRSRSAPPVTLTATGRGRCWEASAGWRSRCRAPG